MANRIIQHQDSKSRAKVAANSTAIKAADFVTLSGGFVTAATGAAKIEGLSNMEETFASDNQTVAKKELSYTVLDPTMVVEMAISGGTITAADEGKYFILGADGRTVDGTSETTAPAYVDTTSGSATDPVIFANLRMVKYISATKGWFSPVLSA